MSLKIVKVRSSKEWKDFLTLPFKLYRHNPAWVPPLIREVKKLFSPENPFWKHTVRELFLAYDNGKPVGRLGCFIDFHYIRFHDEQVGQWGFFECVEDLQVAEGLFDAGETWFRKRGIPRCLGPFNPSSNEECGCLMNAYETPPKIMMTYNFPYYPQYFEALGYEKAKDLYAYLSEITPTPLKRLEKLAQRAYEREPTLTVRKVNLKEFDKDIQAIMDIYNKAWEKNWGFVPLTEEEVVFLAHRLKPVVVPDLVYIAFMGDDPAGFIMTLPDVNQALIHIKGRLGPLSLVKLLYYGKKIRHLRLITMGIKEAYRKKGLDAALYHASLQEGLRLGYTHAEYSWILEDNKLIQKAVTLMGGVLDKTYRIFQKDLP